MLSKFLTGTKKHNKPLFRKLMLYLIMASVLMAFFSSITFFFFGGRKYGKQMLDELIPRATSISNIMSEYYDGIISEQSVNRYVFNRKNDSTVMVFDKYGNPYTPSKGPQLREPFPSKSDNRFTDIVSRVLSTGESVQLTKFDLVLIALPIVNDMNQTNGVVIVMKMSEDLHSAMRSMMLALVTSFFIVIVFMFAFSYYGSKKISDPILKMESIALSMQKGDFSRRADDSIENEIGRLGGALNSLSNELSKTIDDLDHAKNMLNKILNSLSEAVAAFENKKLIFSNPAVLKLLKLTDDKVTFDTFINIIPDFEKHYYKAITDNMTDSVEFDYGECVLGCSFMKLDSSNMDSIGIVLLIRDITEAVRLEQTRRDYVANVSHELKTPITSIRSLAETLNDGMIRSEEEKNRYYGYILRESTRMSHLIEELLELSRIQSGSVAFKKEDFSLNETMHVLIDRMTLIAEYSGIKLNYDAGEKSIMVHSNRSRIEQVAIAIIDNAIKYCIDSGEINIKLETDGDKAVVSIENDGRIDEKDLPHLFDRFYKADKSHGGNGTGLGLAITKEILERLGERITISSDNNKVTFIFTVSLS